jgi:hypothetical protein
MKLSIREVKPPGEEKYEVLFANDAGATQWVVCTIGRHKKDNHINGITLDPDIFWPGQSTLIDPCELSVSDIRELVRAVIAYHHRCLESTGAEH